MAEQLGRVTNGLSWCYPEAQSWMFEASPEQIEHHAKAMMRGERHVCYAITEEGAGSDVRNERQRPAATATTTS